LSGIFPNFIPSNLIIAMFLRRRNGQKVSPMRRPAPIMGFGMFPKGKAVGSASK
jgi:hypothetical protein